MSVSSIRGVGLAALLGVTIAAHPFVTTGTYSLDMSGAIRGHLSGQATADHSQMLSDAGPAYTFVLHLPAGTAGSDPHQESMLIFTSKDQPAPGHFSLVDPSPTVNPKQLESALTGSDERPWSIAPIA